MNSRPLTTTLIHPRTTIKPLLVALAATLLAVLAFASQASAYAVSSTGSPGNVTINRTIQGSHLMTYPSVFSPYLQHQATQVCRSPSTSGDQTVSALYVVYRWNGSSWVKMSPSGAPKATIAAGVNCGTVSNFGWGQTFMQGGYYYVEALFAWQDAYGRLLGSHLVRFNSQQDYSCATAIRTCQVGPGYIYLG